MATVARQDAILAVLRDAEGFPLSTGEVARSLGYKEIGHDWGSHGRYPCDRCGKYHRGGPVWRRLEAQDVRSLLVRLERDGLVERVRVESARCFYWRSSLAPPIGDEVRQ